MRRTNLCLALALLTGCQTIDAGPVEPPPAVHPVDQFPAPPGFTGRQRGPGAWTFTGRGKPRQAALFYRVSCVEFFEWTLAAETEQPDGSWQLEFARDGAALQVRVQGAGNGDSLECFVTLKR